MPLPEIVRWTIALLLTAVLAVAAVTDVRERKIPNWTVLATLVLFIPWAVFHLHPLTWSLWALGVGVIAFAVTFGLYSAGLVGAGDSKLFAAVALFAGIGQIIPLTLATAIIGGLVAMAGFVLAPARALTMLRMRGKGDFGRGVPYGVAIALGTVLVIWAGLLHLGPFPAEA
jgi:prepilin peptidase CpaA